MILEDNNFFNKLMLTRLDAYAKRIAEDNPGTVEILSFTNSDDFIRNLQSGIAIAFVDYYLGGGTHPEEVIRLIREKSPACTIIVVSGSDSEWVVQRIFAAGADGFMHKDPDILDKICLVMESAVYDHNPGSSM